MGKFHKLGSIFLPVCEVSSISSPATFLQFILWINRLFLWIKYLPQDAKTILLGVFQEKNIIGVKWNDELESGVFDYWKLISSNVIVNENLPNLITTYVKNEKSSVY